MPETLSLYQLHIASPCPVAWESMDGGERRRFCPQCQLNVYNLSALSEDDALRLVSVAEGRICAGFFVRSDGMIMTRDCPAGLRAMRRTIVRAGRRIAAAILLLIGAGAAARSVTDGALRHYSIDEIAPVQTARRWLNPTPPPLPPPRWVGGVMSVRPPSASPAGPVGRNAQDG